MSDHDIKYGKSAIKKYNLGRYKSLQIEGLFFRNFNEIFENSIASTIKKLNVPEKEAIEKLKSKFGKLVSNYEDSIANLYLKNHSFKIDTFLKIHFSNQKAIAKKHALSFVPFFLYINGCAEIYEKAIKQIARKRIDSTLKMNLALYGLVVRRAQQIGDSLLSGYIDGAMMMWRSMFENSVILLLLAIENDPKLTDKFYEHSIRNSRNNITSYTKHYKSLKFKPLPKSSYINIQNASENVSNKYGKEFLDNEFGWADDLFPGKQKASFRLLEEKVDMNMYRPYYLLCSEQIHSGFGGLKSYMEGKKLILPRLLDQEIELEAFIDPMQFTLTILHRVNDYILYEFSTQTEYEVNLLLMQKIFDQQQETFKSTPRKNGERV